MCGCNSNFKGGSSERSNNNIWSNGDGGNGSGGAGYYGAGNYGANEGDDNIGDSYAECHICPTEDVFDGVNHRGDPKQTGGCTWFNNSTLINKIFVNGESLEFAIPSMFTNNPRYQGSCPTEGWNSQGLYVTTNAPSSSNNSSPIVRSNAPKINKRVGKKENKTHLKIKQSINKKVDVRSKKLLPTSMGSISKRVKDHNIRFSGFIGKKSYERSNFVDTKKLGIDDEHFFEYNTKHREDFGNFTDKGFLKQNEMEAYEY